MDDLMREYLRRKYLRESEDKSQLGSDLGRAVSTAISGISGQKQDHSFFDNMDAKRIQADARRDATDLDMMKSDREAMKDYIMQKYKIDRDAKDDERADKRLQMDEWFKRNSLQQQNETSRFNAETRRREDDRKAEEKSEKKLGTVREVEERSRNIDDNITKLQQMIQEDGTWEALGPHNQNLDRLVDQIATDTAKLMDPESVARPNEVELVKKNLIRSGFQNSNKTAKDILEAFRKETQGRVDTAYKVRGLTRPGGRAPGTNQGGAPQAGSVIDGYTFKGGDPSKQENWEKVK